MSGSMDSSRSEGWHPCTGTGYCRRWDESARRTRGGGGERDEAKDKVYITVATAKAKHIHVQRDPREK